MCDYAAAARIDKCVLNMQARGVEAVNGAISVTAAVLDMMLHVSSQHRALANQRYSTVLERFDAMCYEAETNATQLMQRRGCITLSDAFTLCESGGLSLNIELCACVHACEFLTLFDKDVDPAACTVYANEPILYNGLDATHSDLCFTLQDGTNAVLEWVRVTDVRVTITPKAHAFTYDIVHDANTWCVVFILDSTQIQEQCTLRIDVHDVLIWQGCVKVRMTQF